MFRFVTNEELSRMHSEKASLERRTKKEQEHFKKYPINMFVRSDYDVRKVGDHYESYNMITGHKLYEGTTYDECYRDLDEEFAS